MALPQPGAAPGFVPQHAAHDEFLAHRPQRFRHLPQGMVLQAKAPPLLAQLVVEPAAAATSLRFGVNDGWFRIMLPAGTAGAFRAAPPGTGPRLHDALVDLRATPAGQACSLSLLVGEAGSGLLRVAHRLSRRMVLDEEARPQRFRLEAAVGQAGFEAQADDAPVFLVLEFEGQTAVELTAFSIVPTEAPPPNAAPYHSSPLPACIALAQLNRDLSTLGRREPTQWRLRALDIAASLDCFETSQGLLASLEGAITPADNKRWPGYLRARAHVGVVTGAIEATRELLLAHLDTVMQDDRLVATLSACLDPDPRYLPLVGRLPSGAVNRFFLSRLPLEMSAVAAGAPPPPNEDLDQQVQRQLFMASLLREVSPAASLAWLNRALASYQLAEIVRLGPADRNVLDGIAFAPVETHRDGPLISVIMAAYNSAETLAYAAGSVLAQSHARLELLLCDDASTDGTAALVRRLAATDSRVRAFRSPRNQGPYNIRNAMIEQAAGDYITFADADDVCHPERLARQLDALLQPAEGSQPVCSISRFFRMMPDGRIPSFRDQRATRGAAVSLLAPAALFREERPFRPVLCGGDTDFYERLRQRHGAGFRVELPEPMLIGLWSGASLTRQPGLEVTEDGYRSPARLALAEICARHRLFGPGVVPEAAIEALARQHGIHRDYAGAEPLDQVALAAE